MPAWWTKPHLPTFLALDFETADYAPDSACAIGLVRVERGTITARVTKLIRPPRQRIVFTHIHGLTWEMLADQPFFAELWPEVLPLFDGLDFIAAHNASFDRRVLEACCFAQRIAMPAPTFLCTVQLARFIWDIRPTNLKNVCRHLRIPLQHHEAGSDAAACAQIVLRSLPIPEQPTLWPDAD